MSYRYSSYGKAVAEPRFFPRLSIADRAASDAQLAEQLRPRLLAVRGVRIERVGMGWRVRHYRGRRGAPVIARGWDEVTVLRTALRALRKLPMQAAA